MIPRPPTHPPAAGARGRRNQPSQPALGDDPGRGFLKRLTSARVNMAEINGGG